MEDQIKNAKRPKPGEDEDALLKQMEEFESSKSSISRENNFSFQKNKKQAGFESSKPPISSENIVNFQKNKKPMSKFAQQRQAQAANASGKTEQKYQQENVLKSVIEEKEFDYEQYTSQIMKVQKSDETGGIIAFPDVKKLDRIVPSEKGKSLFASQVNYKPDAKSSKIQPKSKVNICYFIA